MLWVCCAGAAAGPTRVRSGQIDFGEGVEGGLHVAGALSADGPITADGRIRAGSGGAALTETIGASGFNAWIGSATQCQWLFDASSLSAWPSEAGALTTGLLALRLSPGTRLYRVIVHGAFSDTAPGNQFRGMVWKQSILSAGFPQPLTTELTEYGGTTGAFSLELTPDYAVEEGNACVVQVRMKNDYAGGTLLLGVELVLHETHY